MSALPAGWVAVRTSEGELYYWNEISNETSWDKPAPEQIVSESGTPPPKPLKPKKPPRPNQTSAVASSPVIVVTAPTVSKPSLSSSISRPIQTPLASPPVAASYPPSDSKIISNMMNSFPQSANLKPSYNPFDAGPSADIKPSNRRETAATPVVAVKQVQVRSVNSAQQLKVASLTSEHANSRSSSSDNDTVNLPIAPSPISRFNEDLSFQAFSVGSEQFPRRTYSQEGLAYLSPRIDASIVAAIANHRLKELQVCMEGCPASIQSKVLRREGPLLKLNRDGPKQYQFFLFDDCIIYANYGFSLLGADTTQGNLEKMKMNREIPLDTCLFLYVVDLVCDCRCREGDEGNNSDIFKLMSRQKSFYIQAVARTSTSNTTPQEEKAQWFRECCQAAHRCHSSMPIPLRETDCSPLWEQNDNAEECFVCHVAFGLLNRKHHCRNCGRVVCGDCSMEKVRLDRIDAKGLFRVCRPCAKEVKSTRKYGAVQAAEPLLVGASDEALIRAGLKPRK